ncbi:MAG: hypothetical protein ACD_58C00325G0002 [uncultured bacterium]|nr:MAG: hypothetical protein ACD_58C00325G0002 [uncultured bacterium]
MKNFLPTTYTHSMVPSSVKDAGFIINRILVIDWIQNHKDV